MTPLAPSPRAVDRSYTDPASLIWLRAARRLGIERVQRSAEVFAAYDGAGTLTLAADEHLDADDCLAQLLFHELCHALVEAPRGLELPDWGLDNMGDADLPREWASLRVQAALAEAHGLREVLAPTTDHRAYFDALPRDPLAPLDAGHGGDRDAIAAATTALQRAEEEPWGSALGEALVATANVAAAVAALAPEGSLWRLYRQPASGSSRSS